MVLSLVVWHNDKWKAKTNSHNFKPERQWFWQKFGVRYPAAHNTYTILSKIYISRKAAKEAILNLTSSQWNWEQGKRKKTHTIHTIRLEQNTIMLLLNGLLKDARLAFSVLKNPDYIQLLHKGWNATKRTVSWIHLGYPYIYIHVYRYICNFIYKVIFILPKQLPDSLFWSEIFCPVECQWLW